MAGRFLVLTRGKSENVIFLKHRVFIDNLSIDNFGKDNIYILKTVFFFIS